MHIDGIFDQRLAISYVFNNNDNNDTVSVKGKMIIQYCHPHPQHLLPFIH